jgi:hypothetical protein
MQSGITTATIKTLSVICLVITYTGLIKGF